MGTDMKPLGYSQVWTITGTYDEFFAFTAMSSPDKWYLSLCIPQPVEILRPSEGRDGYIHETIDEGLDTPTKVRGGDLAEAVTHADR